LLYQISDYIEGSFKIQDFNRQKIIPAIVLCGAKSTKTPFSAYKERRLLKSSWYFFNKQGPVCAFFGLCLLKKYQEDFKRVEGEGITGGFCMRLLLSYAEEGVKSCWPFFLYAQLFSYAENSGAYKKRANNSLRLPPHRKKAVHTKKGSQGCASSMRSLAAHRIRGALSEERTKGQQQVSNSWI